MTLCRVAPIDPAARATERGGPLWFPRRLQGDGRHDGPADYACLYVATDPVAAVTEALARFRGSRLEDAMLHRQGQRLALVTLDLGGHHPLVDLDDPAVLHREGLRPSHVATGVRNVTQGYARRLFRERRSAAGLRWWSTFEASWINVTLFDRIADQLSVTAIEPLHVDSEPVGRAARFLGLA